MASFVVYHTPRTGAGYFLRGEDGDYGGTYHPEEATPFPTLASAEEVAGAYGAIGSASCVLQLTDEA
ncbi:hypothetical protein [Pseudomonas sp. EMN2]|uniref:hypothetical protein n=1 Tax=Pseudomonas sp. EMN2 TaxID=2615212 RepID=UPI00129B0E6C|nr:hypothetical protein [Pseudomonas sp. EMN2]